MNVDIKKLKFVKFDFPILTKTSSSHSIREIGLSNISLPISSAFTTNFISAVFFETLRTGSIMLNIKPLMSKPSSGRF